MCHEELKNISLQSFECAITKMNRAGSQKFQILVVAKIFFWFSSSSLYSCSFKHCSLLDKILGISMSAKVIGFAVRFLVNILLICRLKIFISECTWGTGCTSSPPLCITCAAGACGVCSSLRFLQLAFNTGSILVGGCLDCDVDQVHSGDAWVILYSHIQYILLRSVFIV